MSYVSVVPDVITAASGNLEDIGSSLRAAHAAAAAQTTAIAAPAADEVSAAITSFFGTCGQEYQALSAQAAAFHESFVGTLNASVGQYASAEAANVQQTLANAVNAPGQAVASAAAATSADATTESFSTPIGAITLSATGFAPPAGGTGAFGVSATATTPLGGASFTLSGNVSPANTYTVTGGTLHWPGLLALGGAALGPTVTGDASLLNSATTFFTDFGQGNYLGAAQAFLSAPVNYGQAVLVGHQDITIPIDTSSYGGPTVDLNIPFGGLFASSEPITASWPTFTTTQGDTTYTVNGSTLVFGGSQVGGPFAFLLNAFGVSY